MRQANHHQHHQNHHQNHHQQQYLHHRRHHHHHHQIEKSPMTIRPHPLWSNHPYLTNDFTNFSYRATMPHMWDTRYSVSPCIPSVPRLPQHILPPLDLVYDDEEVLVVGPLNQSWSPPSHQSSPGGTGWRSLNLKQQRRHQHVHHHHHYQHHHRHYHKSKVPHQR